MNNIKIFNSSRKGVMGMNNMDNYMEQMAVLCENNDSINKNLYSEYGVKRGLRDENGREY